MNCFGNSFCLLLLCILLIPQLNVQATLQIEFTKTPPRVSKQTNVEFLFLMRNGSRQDPCRRCSIQCKLDQAPFHDCLNRWDSYIDLDDGLHNFEVLVKHPSGSSASARYNWTLDRVPPTGSITADKLFTNELSTILHIQLSEACPGNGGFLCSNDSKCDLVIHGPGTVRPSTLKTIVPDMEYIIALEISNASLIGRVIVALANSFCSDQAGNSFQRNESSSITVRFDRTPVLVNLWTDLTESQVILDNEARTFQATNSGDDIGIFLDFNKPVLNSSQEILSAISASAGNLMPLRRKSHGHRRFGFQLYNLTSSSVVTVKLSASLLMSRDGTLVSPTSPVTFLYDNSRPEVKLSKATRGRIRTDTLPVFIQFTEPVFLFNASDISISSGSIIRFQELTKSTYFVEILALEDGDVSVSVTENKTVDITGNGNLASNLLCLRHYSVPTSAVVSYSFVTAGLLATALISGALSISTTTLTAAGALTTRTANSIMSNPSKNLLRMVGHLQFFAMSHDAAVDYPNEYIETVRGLQWIIPQLDLPWHKQPNINLKFPTPKLSKLLISRRRNLGANASLYGPALVAHEYSSYFQTMHSLEEMNPERTGWDDFGKNFLWLGVFVGATCVAHFILVAFLRWRTKCEWKGALAIPRFQIFLLLASVPCVCQASSFLIQGGSTGSIVLGVLLLSVPATILLSLLIFLVVTVIWGALVQYKEYRDSSSTEKECSVVRTVLGRKSIGRWIRKEGMSSDFVQRFGILFESYKGPANILFVDSECGSKWVDSEGKGIGRRKAVNSDEDSMSLDSSSSSRGHKLLGAFRVCYILVDSSRRICFGIMWGYSSSSSSMPVLFGFTLAQLIYLVIMKPYIRRGVQFVEMVSLGCEAGVLAAALWLTNDSGNHHRNLGIVMVALLLTSFVCQLANEWYALVEQVLKLSETSLRIGVTMVVKGCVFPLIPKRKWPKFITPHSQQPMIGLVPVVHPSPDLQSSRVLPAASSPMHCYDTQSHFQRTFSSHRHDHHHQQQQQQQAWSRSNSMEGKKCKASTSNSNDLKALRELAKASFNNNNSSNQIDEMLPSPSPSSSSSSPSSSFSKMSVVSNLGAEKVVLYREGSIEGFSSHEILPHLHHHHHHQLQHQQL